jgi:hypothetical protein
MAGTEIPTPICTTDRDHPVQSDSPVQIKYCFDFSVNLGSVALLPTRSVRAYSMGRDKKAFMASPPIHSLRECLVA